MIVTQWSLQLQECLCVLYFFFDLRNSILAVIMQPSKFKITVMLIPEIHGDDSKLNFMSLMRWFQKPYKNALIASQDQAWSMINFDLHLKENMLRNITQSHASLAVMFRLTSFSQILHRTLKNPASYSICHMFPPVCRILHEISSMLLIKTNHFQWK